ncbi:MAG: tetratricopeptide repeat protein [Verrucomicrobiaceae bacterium]|nr:tetratricopeptide repeat protein [Verrucomicrobiaceae bacterium]
MKKWITPKYCALLLGTLGLIFSVVIEALQDSQGIATWKMEWLTVGLITFFSGLAGGIVGNVLHSSIPYPEPTANDVFANHHIRHLFQLALIRSIEKDIPTDPFFTRAFLGDRYDHRRRAAHALGERLVTTFGDPSGPLPHLSEKNVTDILLQCVSTETPPHLAPGYWKELVLGANLSVITPAERQGFITSLDTHFPYALWNLCKIARSKYPEAYAAVQLLFESQQKEQLNRIEAKTGSGQASLPPATHNLPTAYPLFGREADLDYFLQQHEKHQAGALAIFGMKGLGGVGKSALALAVAHRLAPRYPDGQIWLDLQGFSPDGRPPLTPEAVLRSVILAFLPGKDKDLPTDLPSLQGLYRSVLTQAGRVLLFLDNARDAQQVLPAIPPANCLLILTSRNHFAFKDYPTIARDIECLQPPAAHALLLERAPRLADAAPEAAQLCGHLPLALRVFADAVAQKVSFPVPHLLQRLRDHATELSPQDAAFRTSYELLPTPLQSRWLALSIFPSSFDSRAAAALWQESDEHTTLTQLQTLIEASLLEFPNGRYKLHDLAAEYALRQLDPATQDTLRLAHAQHYTTIGEEADKLYNTRQPVAGLALFDAERPHIEAAYEWLNTELEKERGHSCPPAEATDSANPSTALPPNARASSSPSDAAANTLRPAGKSARAPLLAQQLISLIRSIVYTGQELRFHPRQCIIWLQSQHLAARQTGHREAEAKALGNLGIAYRQLGEPRKAMELHEHALVIDRELEDRKGEGNALGNLGIAYADLGEPRKAIEFYEEALVIAREIGNRLGEGAVLGNLGLAHADLGEPRKAIGFYEQALVIAREIGDRLGEGAALGNLGIAHADLGEPRKAIGYYEQHRDIAREIGDRRGEGNALGNLGIAYRQLGEPRKAIEFYEQSLVIDREMGNRPGEQNALWNSALANNQLGDRAEAIRRAREALALYEATEDPTAARVRKLLAEWEGGA